MRRALSAHALRIATQVSLVVCLLLVSAFFNAGIAPHHLVLGLYVLPTLFAAHYGGRRYALLTVGATVAFIFLMTRIKPLFPPMIGSVSTTSDALVWAVTLIVIAFVLGTLADHKKRYLQELRETYHGILMLLSHFISSDAFTQNHSYRVSLYATEIASSLGLSDEEVEDIRAAALLHDIGKLEVRRQLLYKAARLTDDEYRDMMHHVDRGAAMLSPVGGSLRRVIPIVLAHHDKYDGSGLHAAAGDDIPVGARVLAVADAYDAMISDRPYRKALSPFEAKQIIQKGAGSEFDPAVVEAFVAAFQRGRLEVTETPVIAT